MIAHSIEVLAATYLVEAKMKICYHLAPKHPNTDVSRKIPLQKEEEFFTALYKFIFSIFLC